MLFSLLLVALLACDEPQQAPAATFADAVQLANDGRESEALAAFQRLVAANPNDHEGRIWIGRLHERMNHPERAEAVYRSVLLEDPVNLDAMLGVAATLLARYQPEEAIDVLERAEKLASQSDVVLAAPGRAYRQAGDTVRAITYYERAFAVAPTEQHRLSLEDVRLSYLHHVETRGFSEQFNGTTPDSRAGDVAVNVRLTDRLRAVGRGQIQRKFRVREERGGGGVEWKWKSTTTLRGQILVGPDAVVMPEGDYLGEIDYISGRATWTATVRYFDFTGAWTSVVSPSVSWLASERLSFGARYALSVTESNALVSRETGHSLHLRGAYR
jgi:tetratricopeptide (TPR) repeat protein